MLQSFLPPQLADFDYAFTETTFLVGLSGLCGRLGPAGGFAWACSAVPSRDGTAANNSLTYMGLTTELRLVFGFS